MSLDKKFANAIPRNEQNLYIYKEHDPTLYWASHAMLVVGYNDALKAFKVVNSWGKNWGNEGYCWISYGFFKKHTSPDYKIGLGEVWFAIDE
jgi:C1A family cysteine protease